MFLAIAFLISYQCDKSGWGILEVLKRDEVVSGNQIIKRHLVDQQGSIPFFRRF